MLYDLNIAWSPSTSEEQLRQTLSLAASFGYGTVALSHILELPLPSKPAAPFPRLTTQSPGDDTATKSQPSGAGSQKLPRILHRATLPLADPAASNYHLPALAAAYDLLAIRPLTDKAFQHACLTLDVPIISLDLTSHFPFHFRPKPCNAAVARGIRFELCYSQSLNADPRGRANWASNATSLIRATRGRGIILSSEAKSAIELRAPADVVNLLGVWGLSGDKGLEGLRSVPRGVVVNEGLKRTGFRGVIDVVAVAKKPASATAPIDREGNGKGNGNGQQKRKPGAEETQGLSKRQAKKLKMASRTAEPAA